MNKTEKGSSRGTDVGMRPGQTNSRDASGTSEGLIGAKQPEAAEGPQERRGATLVSFPMSGHHSIGSVSREAYRDLWASSPDRDERWLRVRNVGLVIGMGMPLHAINKGVLGAAIIEMRAMGMPEAVIDQHLDDFACLMLWADGWGFVEWG